MSRRQSLATWVPRLSLGTRGIRLAHRIAHFEHREEQSCDDCQSEYGHDQQHDRFEQLDHQVEVAGGPLFQAVGDVHQHLFQAVRSPRRWRSSRPRRAGSTHDLRSGSASFCAGGDVLGRFSRWRRPAPGCRSSPWRCAALARSGCRCAASCPGCGVNRDRARLEEDLAEERQPDAARGRPSGGRSRSRPAAEADDRRRSHDDDGQPPVALQKSLNAIKHWSATAVRPSP